MQITFFVSSKTKAKLPLQPTRWDIIVPNVTTRIAETVRQRSKGLPVNSARAILGGSRPIFFTCASPMYFPLFPRPRRRPGVHLGDTDSRTRASENSGSHREEQEASTVEKRRDKRRARACRGGKGGNRAWVGEGALKRRHRAKCSRDKNRHDRRFALENGGLENSQSRGRRS